MNKFFIASWIFVLSLTTQVALASGIIISPVNLSIGPGEKATLLKLTNTKARAMRMQIRIRSWNHGDNLTPQQAIVASPPSLLIGAGETQVVRIVNTGKPASAISEVAYRVLLDEIPDTGTSKVSGLILQMRYALPLFVGGPAMDTGREQDTKKLAQLWKAGISYRIDPDKGMLYIHNQADAHARVSNLRYIDQGKNTVTLVPGLLGYALPGENKAFQIRTPAVTGNESLLANINGADVLLPLQQDAQ